MIKFNGSINWPTTRPLLLVLQTQSRDENQYAQLSPVRAVSALTTLRDESYEEANRTGEWYYKCSLRPKS